MRGLTVEIRFNGKDSAVFTSTENKVAVYKTLQDFFERVVNGEPTHIEHLIITQEKKQEIFDSDIYSYPEICRNCFIPNLQEEKNFIIVLPYRETSRFFTASMTTIEEAYVGSNNQVVHYEYLAERMTKSQAFSLWKEKFIGNRDAFIRELKKKEVDMKK